MSDPIDRLTMALEDRYRIERELGHGGMATVYLAEDLRHGRSVALKVLKPKLAAVVGAERFLDEIKTTANLNHPHILPLHDSGEADGFLFYVMPYVAGETLRERLDRERQLPVDEAVAIASKVASALDYAHEQGIVHRDVKPANVLLDERNEPRVADFGIALAVARVGEGRVTETGLSVGTPHYMSPEQASGDQRVDARADVYALGCVLYEMVTGEPPYPGATAQAVLARILTEPAPSASTIRPALPTHVDAVIRKALEKLPADRFTGTAAFSRALSDPGFRYGDAGVAAAPVRDARWRAAALAMGVLAVTLAAGLSWSLLRPAPDAAVSQLPSPFLEGQEPRGYTLPADMEFTPDGSLVYIGASPSSTAYQLWIRRWDELAATPVAGTESVRGGFALSPDGSEVAFAAQAENQTGLAARIVPLEGGPGRTVVRSGVAAVESWTGSGHLYMTMVNGRELVRAPAVGSGDEPPEVVGVLDGADEGFLFQAHVLPGERMAALVSVAGGANPTSQIWMLDLETGENVLLVEGFWPGYTSTGHFTFLRSDGILMVGSMDPEVGRFQSPPVAVEGGAEGAPFGIAYYAVSPGGTLIYATRGASDLARLVWVDRRGGVSPVEGADPFAPGRVAQLSPDGSRIAYAALTGGQADIWIHELPDGPSQRVTLDDTYEEFPHWTPDGRSVSHVEVTPPDSTGDSRVRLVSRRADGTGAPEVLAGPTSILGAEPMPAEGVWSPDGRWLVIRTGSNLGTEGSRDLLVIRPGSDDPTSELVATEAEEHSPAISRDGRWLAYVSDRSGRDEVYVSPFPDVDAGRWQVSRDGGRSPEWAHNGREIFFYETGTGQVQALEFTAAGQAFRRGEASTLFDMPPRIQGDETINYWPLFDVAPGDDRFLMVQSLEESESDFVLVQNWFLVLRERLERN